MYDTKEKVLAYLQDNRIEYDLYEHPPVFTIDELRETIIPHLDYIVKNLFLRDDKKKNFYLVIIQKDKVVDLKNLKEKIKSRALSFASEDLLFEYLKLKKGSVSPLGILNDPDCKVKIVFDQELIDYPFLGVHPNDNTATLFIETHTLLALLSMHEVITCEL